MIHPTALLIEAARMEAEPVVELPAVELPGAGIVEMSLRDMALAFGVPWAEVRARLCARGLTSCHVQGGMADGPG